MKALISIAFLSIFIQFGYSQNKISIPQEVEQWIQNELSQVQSKVLQAYDKDLFLKKDSVRIIGYIKNYDPSKSRNGMYYNENLLTREDYPTLIRIKPDGRFECKFEINHPIYSYVDIANRVINFYTEPGQTIALVLDKNAEDDVVEFIGPLQKINEELNSISINKPSHRTMESQIKSLTTEEFKKLTLAEMKKEQARVQQLIKEKNISKKAEIILNNEVELAFLYRLSNYPDEKKYYANQEKDNKFLQDPVTFAYFNFMNDVDQDKYSFLINREFSSVINRLEYSAFYPRMEYIREANPYQKLDSVAFLRYHSEEFPLFYSIFTLRSISQELNRPLYFSEENEIDVQYVKEHLKQPFLLAELNRKHKAVKTASSGFEFPNTVSATLFKKLINSYKGKIVIVDFWAENCGPCRANIEQSVELRKHLENHPFLEFVFITDKENTSDSFYNEYIKKNGMTNSHIVSANDYLEFRELFRFNGIPRYVLIDEMGKIKDNNFLIYNLEPPLIRFFPEKIKKEDFIIPKTDAENKISLLSEN